jgi:hypothetical protein
MTCMQMTHRRHPVVAMHRGVQQIAKLCTFKKLNLDKASLSLDTAASSSKPIGV